VCHGWVTSYLEFAKEIISISLRKKAICDFILFFKLEEEQFDVIFPNYIFRLELVCLKAYSILFLLRKLLCDFIEKKN
jgi:hypothetical protein